MDVRVDHKEDRALKNWCFWTVVLKKTLESPLYCKEIKPANPKGNQPWIFIRRTNAEVPVLWSPYAKSQLIGKDPDAGKDWRQKEKGAAEDDMIGWHHQLTGHEFEQKWRSEEPGVLQFTRRQRVRQDLATEQEQTMTGGVRACLS